MLRILPKKRVQIHVPHRGDHGLRDPGVARSHRIEKLSNFAAYAFFIAAYACDRQEPLSGGIFCGKSFADKDERTDQPDVALPGLRYRRGPRNAPIQKNTS